MTRLPRMLALAGIVATCHAAPFELPLWPGVDLPKIPEPETTKEHSLTPELSHNRGVTFVSVPTITVYLPDGVKAPVPAVIICPGGGYKTLSIDSEGYNVAARLNTFGVASIVLKYRLPRPELSGTGKPWPLLDAAQAIRLVRAHAAEWHIDPHRVGLMGFSAGGHLASTLATHFEIDNPQGPDPISRLSSRPDFVALLYPVVTLRDPLAHKGSRESFIGKDAAPQLVNLYSNELQVTKATPPTFVAVALDDKTVPPANSIQFADAMQKAGVDCELHVFASGGHGFVHNPSPDATAWPTAFQAWLKKEGILP